MSVPLQQSKWVPVSLAIVLALTWVAMASAHQFRSPDGRIYCYFSSTEPVAACMTGRGSGFRAGVLTPGDMYGAISHRHYGKQSAPSGGARMSVGASVRDPYLPGADSMTCRAVRANQIICYRTTSVRSGFTIWAGCPRRKSGEGLVFTRPSGCFPGSYPPDIYP
jgi:hypothetical protein